MLVAEDADGSGDDGKNTIDLFGEFLLGHPFDCNARLRETQNTYDGPKSIGRG
jgi:hypothetical protein